MPHLFWLDPEHLKRSQHVFPRPNGLRGSTTEVFSAVSSISYLMAYCGEIHWPTKQQLGLQ